MAHTLQLSSGQYTSMACLQKTEQWYALWCPDAQNKNFSPTLEAAIILWVGIDYISHPKSLQSWTGGKT